jgi:two-component system phosphate regulon response regulator OmpR
MEPAAQLLVVDDDASVREMLAEYLGTHGFAVRTAANGATMRAALEAELPDLVLLDLRLPGEDGLTLARFLRERYDLGIVMVTAAGDTVDRVVGLEVGADDYVAKPFDPRELLARVKSVLRRMQARAQDAPTAAPAPAAATPARQRFGRCEIELDSRRLFDLAAEGAELPMTAMEYDLIRVLPRQPQPRAVTRPAADAHPQPRVGAVRPLDRHPHRPAAAQGRTRPDGRAALHPHGAQRRVHVRARRLRPRPRVPT